MDWRVAGCELPSEIWHLIASYLPVIAIVSASLASKNSRKCLHYLNDLDLTKKDESVAWGMFEGIARRLPHIRRLSIAIRTQSHVNLMQNLTLLENLQELQLFGGIYLNVGHRPDIFDITKKLPHLQRLLLEIYPRNLDQIIEATPNLTSLAISTARRDKLVHLNSLTTLSKLKELKITAIGNKATEPFDKFSRLTTLTKLNLTGAAFNDVLSLGDLTLLADLQVLKLNQIKYDSMNGVMYKLTNLRRLDFLQHIHGSSSETLLDECEGLTRLTHVYIDDVYGKEEKILQLTQLKSFAVLGIFSGIETMSHLRKLKLISMVQVDSFKVLCSTMTALERLYLWSWLNMQLNNEGFQYITKLNNLTSLYIHGLDSLTDEGFGCVSRLTRLRKLEFSGEGVTTDVLSELQPLTNLKFLCLNSSVVKQ